MSWIQGLNPEQAEAVAHTSGPLLILAGAGSGKTTVLVSRTGRLIQEENIKPSRICVLTFTNKAARELKHRVSHRLGPQAKNVWAGTFHAFGLHLLKKHHKLAHLPADFGVLDQTDSQALVREILKDIKVVGKERYDLDRLLNLVQRTRAGENLRHEAVDEYTELAEMLGPKYENRLDLLGVVDFESLLLKPLELFKSHPEFKKQIQAQYDQIMVNEFQDTNQVQMRLIHDLMDERRNITVVGDDDQSIYGWRGAEVKNILQFPQNYKPCRVIKLERNYRSQPAILNLANAVISKNQARHGKVLRAEKTSLAELPELFVMEQEDDESEFVVREIQNFLKEDHKPHELAVLYRSNAQGALIESGLRRAQIPYAISGGTSIFDRKEAKDLMAFLRQALSPNEVSLKRIINLPARGIGETSLEMLNNFAKAHNITFAQACLRWQEVGLPEKTGLNLADWMGYLQYWPGRLVAGEDSKTPGAVFLESLDEIGYKTEVYQSSNAPGGGEKRWMVVEIFARILDSFLAKRDYSIQSLREFVEVMTLRNHDETDEVSQVQLMTLHASKGLEFPVVMLVGLEEDLLPHRSLGGNIDEERRLFYVGITRAQQKLILTRCRSRKRHGALRPVSPSRFLVEIADGFIKEFPAGVRPVAGVQRDQLIASFLAGLEKKSLPKN
ncbi:MAG: UvrD-helicase domain-containing protein [Bdellovibrionales bacterium]|nr:UvrD-helicase domain-containing protein [Bdellovibrionales bacterium]